MFYHVSFDVFPIVSRAAEKEALETCWKLIAEGRSEEGLKIEIEPIRRRLYIELPEATKNELGKGFAMWRELDRERRENACRHTT